ncbi:addiction module toxin, HicA family [Acidaminobacter sp. JC074]|uniref:type II toxin-antitoxin system HicA family toxin n=1 Tax=Acidaminobacter sp. JC074 TaxID=2530199 RepID=UPI001F0D0677|nr:type II toxin-antitoxin system HicA family toxin [Acidaminobacter sp. JC074]MCH4890673.1 addiction module toxin, HicA family [Acidaminobacter sp. JC074]
MSKREKLLNKIKNNPTNVKFETLQTLLLHYGFIERQPKKGSSHYTYVYGNLIITIPKHKPVNKIYVKQFLKLIDDLEKGKENSYAK